MSRNNTHYYNICEGDEHSRYGWMYQIYEDGYCSMHRPGIRGGPHRKCIPPGDFATRRGVWQRRKRFPEHSVKTFHSGPPASIKAIWHRKARSQQRQEFLRNPEDPVITPMKRLIDLWDWY